MEIGLGGVVEGDENHEVKGAGEPAEAGFEKRVGLSAALRSEPIAFVGQVNELDGQASDDEGYGEPDDGHRESDHRKRHEEAGLGLPAVGRALGVEMRSDDVRQFGIEQGEVDGGEEHQQQECKFGQARIHIVKTMLAERETGDPEKAARMLRMRRYNPKRRDL